VKASAGSYTADRSRGKVRSTARATQPKENNGAVLRAASAAERKLHDAGVGVRKLQP